MVTYNCNADFYNIESLKPQITRIHKTTINKNDISVHLSIKVVTFIMKHFKLNHFYYNNFLKKILQILL